MIWFEKINPKTNKKKYIYLYLKIFLYFPLILVFVIFRIFCDLRIGVLDTEQFGEFIIQAELFSIEKKAGIYKKKKLNVLWFKYGKISNHLLLKKYKRDLIILPAILLEPLFIFFKLFNATQKFIYLIEEIDPIQGPQKRLTKRKDENNLLPKSKSSIQLTSKEIQRCLTILKPHKIDLNSKIITFSTRSKFYKNEKFESIRNTSIEEISKSFEFLINEKFKIFKIGKDKETNFQNKNIIDLSLNENDRELIDLFLIYRSNFFISPATGVGELGTIARKKKLVLDFIDFGGLYCYNLEYTNLILPKKFINLKTNELFTYREILEKKIYLYKTQEDLREVNIAAVNNNYVEISRAIQNMFFSK